MTDNHIHVGGRRVDIEKAAFWIKDYSDETANREAATLGKGPVHACPAYDRLATGSGPNELNGRRVGGEDGPDLLLAFQVGVDEADTTLLRVFDVVAWRLGRGDAGS
ncbi:hypothetical protein ACF08B_33805 [Streptomyces sp. NPDC015139]|uniref:hypothetical protein n=1 Tax=Streptomyces sp. NPDC015139 TaxID=3364942 RepID=UPI0036F8358A